MGSSFILTSWEGLRPDCGDSFLGLDSVGKESGWSRSFFGLLTGGGLSRRGFFSGITSSSGSLCSFFI
jgi:hypothetical protein